MIIASMGKNKQESLGSLQEPVLYDSLGILPDIVPHQN